MCGCLRTCLGGTNFGFMNGANDGHDHKEVYMPDVTSYGEWRYCFMQRNVSALFPVLTTSPLVYTLHGSGLHT